MRAFKPLTFIGAAALLSACSTFSRTTDDSLATAQEDLAYAQARTVELETELVRTQTENARLANQLMELERETERLRVAAAKPEEVAEEIVPETPAPTAQLREPVDLPDAIVDNPQAPEISRSDVPVQQSPRLTQPTFASSDAVFENEAVGEGDRLQRLFGVHLASYRQPAEAREGWRKLQRENPDELGLLEPRLDAVELPERGMFLRLIGGGFSSREKAHALCANLKAKRLFCDVAEFSGQRLSLNEKS